MQYDKTGNPYLNSYLTQKKPIQKRTRYWKLKFVIAISLMGLGLFLLMYLLAQIASGIWLIIGSLGLAFSWLYFILDLKKTFCAMERLLAQKHEAVNKC